MIWWDRELQERMKENSIECLLMKRYVDDITLVLSAETISCQVNKKRDETVMESVLQIGNGIHKTIQLEIDFPSKHHDNKLTILDLKVWIDGINRNDGRSSKVLQEFYTKDVSSKMMIHARSAVSWNMKRTSLTQQVLRVMLNCSRLLPWKVTERHVTEMMKRLQFSGYNQMFRA